jgi:hypothetical protein
VAADPVEAQLLTGVQNQRQAAFRHLHLLPGLLRGVQGAQVRGQEEVGRLSLPSEQAQSPAWTL